MNLKTATIAELLEAERLAIKYSPRFTLVLSEEYYRRNPNRTSLLLRNGR